MLSGLQQRGLPRWNARQEAPTGSCLLFSLHQRARWPGLGALASVARPGASGPTRQRLASCRLTTLLQSAPPHPHEARCTITGRSTLLSNNCPRMDLAGLADTLTAVGSAASVSFSATPLPVRSPAPDGSRSGSSAAVQVCPDQTVSRSPPSSGADSDTAWPTGITHPVRPRCDARSPRRPDRPGQS